MSFTSASEKQLNQLVSVAQDQLMQVPRCSK